MSLLLHVDWAPECAWDFDSAPFVVVNTLVLSAQRVTQFDNKCSWRWLQMSPQSSFTVRVRQFWEQKPKLVFGSSLSVQCWRAFTCFSVDRNLSSFYISRAPHLAVITVRCLCTKFLAEVFEKPKSASLEVITVGAFWHWSQHWVQGTDLRRVFSGVGRLFGFARLARSSVGTSSPLPLSKVLLLVEINYDDINGMLLLLTCGIDYSSDPSIQYTSILLVFQKPHTKAEAT